MLVEVKVVNNEGEDITTISHGVTLEERIECIIKAVQNELSMSFEEDEFDEKPGLEISFSGNVLCKERKFKDYLDLLKSSQRYPNDLIFFAQIIVKEDMDEAQSEDLEKGEVKRKKIDSCRSSKAQIQATPIQLSKFKRIVELATNQFSTGLKKNSIKNLRKAIIMEIPGCESIRANIEMCLGFLNNVDGNLDATLSHFQKGLETFFNIYGVKCELTGSITANIGNVFLEMDDLIQALEFQKSAKTIIENIDNTDHIQTVVNYNLGLVHFKMGNYNMSLEICKKSLEESLQLYGENDVRVGDLFNLISDNLWKMCIYEDSLEFVNKSLKIYEENLPEDHLKIANALEKQGMYYAEITQDFDLAEDCFKKSLNIKQSNLDAHPSVADCCFNLSRMYLIQEDASEASKYLWKCTSILAGSIAQISGFAKTSETCKTFFQRLVAKYVKASHMYISLLYNDSQSAQVLNYVNNFEKIIPRENLSRPFRCFLCGIKSMANLFLGNKKLAYELGTQNVEYCKEEYGQKHGKTLEAYFRLGVICKELQKNDEALIYLSSAEPVDSEELQDGSPYLKFKDHMKLILEEI